MKWLKSILVSVLITYLFLGNVGMAIFKHYCEEDGLYTSYFINSQKHCQNEEVPESTLPACCKKTRKELEKSIKDDCCSDEFKVFKVALDYCNDKQDLEFNESIIFNDHTFEYVMHSEKISSFTIHKYNNPPPKHFGKSLLIKNQVLRI
jgi:hypothetical protein